MNLAHSGNRKKVNMATAKMRSAHKSNTKNYEKTQRFSLSWEEKETKAVG